MNTLHRLCAVALLSGLGASAVAQHAERCEPIPKDQWKTRAELEQKLIDAGWKIRRVKIENGCFEVYGTDERGARAEVFFHPKTLERVTAPKK